MALVDCDFFSESLEVGTSVTVVLPQETEAQIGVDADGADERGDCRSSTCCTASPTTTRPGCATPRSSGTPPAAGLAVVMPAVGRSFYADERHGHRLLDLRRPRSCPG